MSKKEELKKKQLWLLPSQIKKLERFAKKENKSGSRLVGSFINNLGKKV